MKVSNLIALLWVAVAVASYKSSSSDYKALNNQSSDSALVVADSVSPNSQSSSKPPISISRLKMYSKPARTSRHSLPATAAW